MMNSGKVQAFYDDFLWTRMVGYRIDGNLRLKLASEFLIPLVGPRDVVADIGCGIGIVAGRIAKARPRARVIGVDLSSANIEYAKETVKRPNIAFYQFDVTNTFDSLRALSPSGYDILALVDVVEHIPEDSREEMFLSLAEVATPQSRLALTYPSPEYQQYLMKENPAELQVIDNTVELEVICREALHSGWHLRYYRRVDVWRAGQYIHCVFDRGVTLRPIQHRSRSLAARALRAADRLLLRPCRVWFYRDRVMRRSKSGR